MTSAPTPDPRSTAGRVDWLLLAALLAMAGVFVRAILYTPAEATQGLAQKIYYIHVPAAMAAYLAMTIVALMSLVHLWLRDPRADRMAESADEVGLVFLTAVLITGPLWGKPVWGTWWTWDMRLTLTLFLWFIAAAYMVLRGAVDDPSLRARYSAVLGLLAALLIPFIHMSVYLFRTLHPMPIVLKPDRPSLPGSMLTTFTLGTFAALFLCAALIRARYRYTVEREMLARAEAGEMR